MSGLTFEALALVESEVKTLLDEPARKFLQDATVLAILKRVYNLVFDQIDITVNPPATGNQIIVKDAIYAISAWESFGVYGQSISTNIQLQDISAYRANLDHLEGIAKRYAVRIGINLNPDEATPMDDPIPVIKTGGSFIDIDRTQQ